MRKIVISTLASAALFLAVQTAQGQTYDVSYKGQSFEQVIKDLRKRTGYQFVYKKDVAQDVGPITAHYKGATLEQLLNRIFYEEAELDYEISHGTVILRKSTRHADSRPFYKQNVTGVVTDDHDEPLMGATVQVKGTSNGVVTDLDGHFSLIVEGRQPVLEVSYVGMKTKNIRLTQQQGRKPLMVQLDTDENLLSEILVTGFQNIKRENATGAYQIVSAQDIDRQYTSDVASRLEGQIPGLTVYRQGGDSEASLTIRGVGSFEGNTSPLVVVDGLPIEGGIETVNAYDIETITVLKDASAASIYGARASNGVIVITTKRAHSDRLSIDFNADLTITGKQSYDNRRWANAAEVMQVEKANFDFVSSRDDLYSSLLGQYAAQPGSLSHATRLLMAHKLGAISDADFNQTWSQWLQNDYRGEWRDAMLRTQIQHQYNLALRTQNKKLSSSLVMNYQGDNEGVVKEHDNTLRLSYTGDYKPTKWLDLSFGASVISERAKNHYSGSSDFNQISSFAPYLSMRNADGTLADMEADVYLGEASLANKSLGLKSEAYNLLDEVGMNFTNSRRNNIRSFAHATVKLLPELSVSGKFQYEDIIYKGETYIEPESYTARHLYNLATSDGIHYIPEGGMLRSHHENGDYYTFRTQANFQKAWAEKHALEAIAGFEYRQTKTRSTRNLLLGYDDATQTNSNHLINFGILNELDMSDLGSYYSPMGSLPTEDDFATSEELHRFYSYYATANYTFDGRYSLSGSYRVDKADLFGTSSKFRGRPLWSVGASWNMDREEFIRQLGWIDALKLRASYGLTGNIVQNVSSFLTATISTNDITGNKQASLNTPPNDQLRWEKTASWNFGADFSLLKNRLSGSLDYYIKTGSDLLTLTDIDPTTGWSSLTINNGKARNTGVELQLDGAIIQPQTRDDFGLRLGFNIARNHNRVLAINHEPTSGYEALQTLHVGRPVNSLFSYRYAGMQTEGDTQAYGWYDKDGNIHNTDVSSGEFSADDIVYSGSLDPKTTASLTPELSWKGFTLSALFSYYGGHVMRAAMEDWTTGGSTYGYKSLDEPMPAAFANYWNGTSDIANGYLGQNTIGVAQYIDQTVMKADYMKLRNIVVGYDFDKRTCQRLGLMGLRLRVQMSNVAKWVRNSEGIDPEAVNPYSGMATAKPMKSYTMSVSVNF